mmetsp:Transcript_11433/g.16354  ORF Transcript_11433/g.16354 Transcript_11433/m.16354 type:complete len:352 (-) Transcript_11433:12-1067(-)
MPDFSAIDRENRDNEERFSNISAISKLSSVSDNPNLYPPSENLSSLTQFYAEAVKATPDRTGSRHRASSGTNDRWFVDDAAKLITPRRPDSSNLVTSAPSSSKTTQTQTHPLEPSSRLGPCSTSSSGTQTPQTSSTPIIGSAVAPGSGKKSPPRLSPSSLSPRPSIIATLASMPPVPTIAPAPPTMMTDGLLTAAMHSTSPASTSTDGSNVTAIATQTPNKSVLSTPALTPLVSKERQEKLEKELAERLEADDLMLGLGVETAAVLSPGGSSRSSRENVAVDSISAAAAASASGRAWMPASGAEAELELEPAATDKGDGFSQLHYEILETCRYMSATEIQYKSRRAVCRCL